jgi:uncharacterized hydrophobic protein (TIGR00341 family)
MKRLDIHLRDGPCADLVDRLMKSRTVIDYYVTQQRQSDRIVVTALMRDGEAQALKDALREILEGESDWRMNLSTVDATSPSLPEPTETSITQHNRLLREELYASASEETKLGPDYFLLIALSTIVAAIGLNSDSAAAVIGSMVIAPLLSPIIAAALGIALGDLWLIRRAGKALVLGLILVILGAYAIGLVISIDLSSDELIQRAEVGLNGLALAVAAGTAGAIARLKDVGAGLVGVMVAAALLPSGAASGVFAAAGEWSLSARALLLTLLNVVSLVAAAVIVFRVRKITPRRDHEKNSARTAVIVSLIGFSTLLVLACALIITLDLGASVSIGDN